MSVQGIDVASKFPWQLDHLAWKFGYFAGSACMTGGVAGAVVAAGVAVGSAAGVAGGNVSSAGTSVIFNALNFQVST